MRCINEQCNREIGEALFCPYCGTKQVKQKRFCSYCGTEMESDAMFCCNCGKKSFFAQGKDVPQLEKQQEQVESHEETEASLDDYKDRVEQAQAMYTDLMMDLIPDIISGKETLDLHLYFVKKIAHDSGWNHEEVAAELSAFLNKYEELKRLHPNDNFSNNEFMMLAHHANKAHIDFRVLDKII